MNSRILFLQNVFMITSIIAGAVVSFNLSVVGRLLDCAGVLITLTLGMLDLMIMLRSV